MKVITSRLRRDRIANHVQVGEPVLGDSYQGQVEARKSAAGRHVEPGGEAARRIAAASPGYLLAHDSGDIARHCQLLSPLAAPGEVRALVTPGRSRGEWHLDVASRDRHGLLAAFTGVLAARYLDVAQAVVATWSDGAALQAFVIRSAGEPDVTSLRSSLQISLAESISSAPLFDAVVVFDNDASPLFTRCDVRAADRVGLLHSVATAIAAAGADVHAAGVSTSDGVALDRFDLSSPNGQKLSLQLQGAIDDHVHNGVANLQIGGGRNPSRRSRST